MKPTDILRIGFCFFLTAGMLGLLYVLLFNTVTLSQDSRAILETVLASLTTILTFAVHSVFRDPTQNPTMPASPPAGDKTP